MKQTLVGKKKWITEKDFMDALSLAQALPGATGVTVLGYVGYKLKKIWGGVLAPLGFVAPPTIPMLALRDQAGAVSHGEPSRDASRECHGCDSASLAVARFVHSADSHATPIEDERNRP